MLEVPNSGCFQDIFHYLAKTCSDSPDPCVLYYIDHRLVVLRKTGAKHIRSPKSKSKPRILIQGTLYDRTKAFFSARLLVKRSRLNLADERCQMIVINVWVIDHMMMAAFWG